MIENSLSVCMITKNEEKNIERCLKSIQNIADEIIVVDTGSTDNTVEIAKSLGAQVYSRQWVNDFSDARNASIDKATKNWILFLDADEEVPEEEGLALKQILQNETRFEGFYLRLVNIIAGVDIGDAIVLRVFKNKPEYRFRGKMHEQIINSMQEIAGMNCIGSTAVRILHYGYDPEVSDPVQKQKRNIDLLNSYPESDRDGYFYYSLGNEYARISENDKALEIYQQALDKTNLKLFRPIYYPYLVLNIAKVLSVSGRFNDEIKAIKKCIETSRDFKDIYFMECLAYIECAKFSKAKESLLNYLNCQPGHYEYPSNNFDKNYNIDELLGQLSQASVDHDEKLISVLIMVNEHEETLFDTVKSLNEIAYEVIIVTPKNSDFNSTRVKNVGARVIEVASDDKDKNFIMGIKNCRGKYILLMNPKELCSFDTQKELIRVLNNTSRDLFNLLTINQITGETRNEFRLFKNSKKINNFNDFTNFINSKKVDDLPIYIHKI